MCTLCGLRTQNVYISLFSSNLEVDDVLLTASASTENASLDICLQQRLPPPDQC